MKLIADYHIHSKYSRFKHGKDTIENIAKAANRKGLIQIAITDHGYKHMFRTNEINILKCQEEIDNVNKWSGTKVMLGIEADIIAEDGTLDIDEDSANFVDILIVGYHKLIKTDFAGFFGCQRKTEEAIQKATNAYINAIKRYPVSIISHLDSVLTTNLYEIGLACKEKGVLIEINNRHCKWTQDQVDQLIASGCNFIVNSDAHRKEDVGIADNAFKIIKKYNIPYDSIVNIELEENEKTEADKFVDKYMNIYGYIQQEKENKREKIFKKRSSEFSNKISDEMEEKLRQIAKENDLEYSEYKDEEEKLEEIYRNYSVFFQETEELIEQAKAYLEESKKNTIKDKNVYETKDKKTSFNLEALQDEEYSDEILDIPDDIFEKINEIPANTSEEKVDKKLKETNLKVQKPKVVKKEVKKSTPQKRKTGVLIDVDKIDS